MVRVLVFLIGVFFLQTIGNCQIPPGYPGQGTGGGLGPIPPTTIVFVPSQAPRIADGTLDMLTPNDNDCVTESMSALAVDSSANPFTDFRRLNDASARLSILNVVTATAGRAKASSECFAQVGPSGVLATGNFGVNVNTYSKGFHHSQRIQQNRTGLSRFARNYVVRLPPSATFGVLVAKLKAEILPTGALTGAAGATVSNQNPARLATVNVLVDPVAGQFQNNAGSVGHQANATCSGATNRTDRLLAGPLTSLNVSYMLVGDGDIIGINSETRIEWNPAGQNLPDGNGFVDGSVLSKGFVDVKVMAFDCNDNNAPKMGFPLTGAISP